MKWRSEAIKFAVLLMVAVGGGPAGAALWQWSTTPATNSTADPGINWSAGIPPSTITPNGRATMAAIASWRNDLAAVTTLGGTGASYTLTSNQGGFTPTADRNGFVIGFVVNATNAIGAAINVDGGGAKPLRTVSGTTIAAGVLIAGQIHQATYRFATDEWVLHGAYTFTGGEVPLGGIIDYAGPSSPSPNFVEPQNQCLSTSIYSALFGLIGHTYSGVAACPGGTFGLPDLRGRVVAGADAGLGRLSCSDTVGCGSQSKTLAIGELPSHQHTFSGTTDSSGAHSHQSNDASNKGANAQGGPSFAAWQGSTTSVTSTDGTHTHPFSGFTNFTGGGSSFSLVQPTITMRKLMRVL